MGTVVTVAVSAGIFIVWVLSEACATCEELSVAVLYPNCCRYYRIQPALNTPYGSNYEKFRSKRLFFHKNNFWYSKI